MSQYIRHTPQIQVSTAADYLDQLIADADPEDFVSARNPYSNEVFAPANDAADPWTGIDLDGWVGVALSGAEAATTNFVPLMARFKNVGSEPAYVYWLPLDAGLGTFLSTNTQYMILLPGQSAVVYARWTEDLYNNAAKPGALGVNSAAGSDGTTVEVTVIQTDIADALEAMGLTAA